MLLNLSHSITTGFVSYKIKSSLKFLSSSNPLDIITRKTSVKFSTCEPVYQEVLTFPLNENEVPNTCLHIILKDNCDLTSDECLGEITLTLSSLDIKNGQISWLKLMPKVSFIKG